jgi:Asp/Glu/hydantoin racemase
MKNMGMLHTSFVFVNVEPVFQNLFKECLPDVQVVDFVDSDILASVIRDGGIKDSHHRRMAYMALAAEAAGADVIFSACSSLGPTIDTARRMVKVPVVKIDDPMTQKAVELGSMIGVMATVPTTLPPTINLIQEKADKAEKQVKVNPYLAEGAFNILMGGNREKHDQMVLEGALALAPRVDLIVLAQASMSRLAPMLAEETGKTVLSSPRMAVEYLQSLFDQIP